MFRFIRSWILPIIVVTALLYLSGEIETLKQLPELEQVAAFSFLVCISTIFSPSSRLLTAPTFVITITCLFFNNGDYSLGYVFSGIFCTIIALIVLPHITELKENDEIDIYSYQLGKIVNTIMLIYGIFALICGFTNITNFTK